MKQVTLAAAGMAAVISTLAFNANAAVVERQTIQMTANISTPNGATTISPTAGSWPTAAQVVSWSGGAFSNPAPIGFTVKSSENVSLSLSSTAELVDGQAKIPLNVAVKSTGGTGTAIPNLTMLPQKIYSKPTGSPATPAIASYTLDITATKTGMTDATGGTTTTPVAGNYTGAVALVFESNP